MCCRSEKLGWINLPVHWEMSSSLAILELVYDAQQRILSIRLADDIYSTSGSVWRIELAIDGQLSQKENTVVSKGPFSL